LVPNHFAHWKLKDRRTREKLQKTGLALPFGHSLEA